MTHPDAETLAAFADGNLPRAESAAVLAHLDRCADCTRAVISAGSREDDVQQRASAPRWPWLAAAAIVLALLGVFALKPSPEDRLVELAPRAARVLQPRLSGDFPYAPWRGPMRSTGAATDAQRLQLAGAAGELVEHADRKPTAETQHAAGVALVLIEEPLAAVARLREAAEREPTARTWSDLAAAKFAAAARLERPSLYPEALADADRALRIDPKFAPALFNRALTLEQMGLAALAREAWERYLDVDASSPWAIEAREHLARLPRTTAESQFRDELPRFERAAASGENVDAFVARHATQTRAFGEAEHLGRWGEAELRGDAQNAARDLAIARATAHALVRHRGESLLRDAVLAIDNATADRRRALAAAHQLYRRGRMLYGQQQPASAEADLREAARQFAAAQSPMALVARYYAACTRYDGNDVDAAESELRQLLTDLASHDRYLALGAQVRWQLALCLMSRDDWQGALPVVVEAETTFRNLGERANAGFVQTLRADALRYLGRPEESWLARIESFRVQSAEGRSDRLPVSIGGAARMELREGNRDAARALLALEADATRARGSEHLLANVQMRAALLAAAAGDDDAALLHARTSATTAERIADRGLRARAIADARLAEGAARINSDARRAYDALTFAVDDYARSERTHFLPEAHLLRARALLRTGDARSAEAELARGIARLEEAPVKLAAGVVGTGIFDAGRTLYREAIALALDRNDAAAALELAERTRTRVGAVASAEEIRRRLHGSGAAIVELVALADHVATICVSEREVAAARTKMPRARLEVFAAAAIRGDASARAALYDALFREPERCLAGAQRLVVVADPLLDGVPFAALYDSAAKQHLVERVPLSMALSASSLVPRRHEMPRSVAAIALPAGEREGTVALPRAARELEDVRAMYARASTDLASADVVHIAGHTTRTPSGALHMRFDGATAAGTVVLAACETLRTTRATPVSLGGSFLARGAGDVIGTLDVIADEDAYELFRNVHRALAAGVTADEAVRRAQLAAIDAKRAAGWGAVAVLTRRIPDRAKGGSSWAP